MLHESGINMNIVKMSFAEHLSAGQDRLDTSSFFSPSFSLTDVYCTPT